MVIHLYYIRDVFNIKFTCIIALQTVRSQQRAERDAAIARLDQSRIILAMRLAGHQGKKYKVIEEAMEFVGYVHDTGHFVSPENLYEIPRNRSGCNLEIHEGKRSSVLMQMLISGLALANKSFRLERIGNVLGNAAMFAVSMLAFLQLHQVAFRSDTLQIRDQAFYRRNGKNISKLDNSSQTRQMKHFDVLSARARAKILSGLMLIHDVLVMLSGIVRVQSFRGWCNRCRPMIPLIRRCTAKWLDGR
ncbi:plastid division protein PDV1-like [Elaeis guineensis]|uniref:plastid division protein PDV1-like n=1 Tax=Elaeis guineensis var. tenera TaxID=51953 RepID=UPI003C6DA5D9